MYKILRIICCAISALLLAGCVFFFIYLGNVWGIGSIILAGAFFALTILFKTLQEDKAKKDALNKPTQPEQTAEQQTEPTAEETDDNQ